ncbi:MAG: putative baseplate assembly protein [Euryarchaeota archaeon]|nr:putative baseplate assembly protein [Euryarchaeota archaeon]
MSIDVPQLDELEYEELVDRGRTLISSSDVAWTDFNPHDPGITILELLAWLTETHSYELDQITDAHREKHLQLLGVRPTPPQPASVVLDLSPAEGGAGRLPANTPLRVDDGSGTLKTFETTHRTTLTDCSLAAVVADHDQGHEPKTDANETDGVHYRAFGDDPAPGSVLALGFAGDPFESAEELSLFVDFHDDDLPDPSAGSPPFSTSDPATFEPSVELVWEYCRGYRPADREAQWEPLAVGRDTTNSLYETGFVTLERPATWEPTAWGSQECGLFGHQPGLVWLRCRVETGGYEIPPQLDAVELNVVEASHRRHHEATLEPCNEGVAGTAPETYEFDHAPVLSATVSVDGEPWSEVADFDASGPADRHYVLDRQQGILEFGDNRTGRRPPVDATVTASYIAGGGADGNVPETASWWFIDGDQQLGDGLLEQVDVSPKGAATGGRGGESIEEAIDRCKRDFDTTYRAVTESEYAELAERTPGLRIARTAVDMPADAASAVSVVVPYAPPDVTRPTPSEGFREAVEKQLDSHRLLTDRVAVVPPTYVGLDISVSVTVTDRYAGGGDRSAIETRLEAYLDPIRGFEGEGWPFGRSLTTAELREELLELPAVDHVDELSVRTVGDASVTPDGTVRIDDGSLFYIEHIAVESTVRDGGSN